MQNVYIYIFYLSWIVFHVLCNSIDDNEKVLCWENIGFYPKTASQILLNDHKVPGKLHIHKKANRK